MRTQKTYKFRVGEEFSLDYIYNIQALGGGTWWQRTGKDTRAGDIDMSEALVCVKDITITITVVTPNVEGSGAPASARPQS